MSRPIVTYVRPPLVAGDHRRWFAHFGPNERPSGFGRTEFEAMASLAAMIARDTPPDDLRSALGTLVTPEIIHAAIIIAQRCADSGDPAYLNPVRARWFDAIGTLRSLLPAPAKPNAEPSTEIVERLRTELPGDWHPADPPTDPNLIPWYANPEQHAYLTVGASLLYVGIRDDQFVIGTHEAGITASARILPHDRIAEQVVLLASHERIMGRPCPPLPKWPQIAAAVKWRRECVASLEDSYRRALHNAMAEREYLDAYTETP